MVRRTLKEFQDFILKGNAFDMAIGVIIGAAFSAIVTSLVADVLMPPIGFITGGVDFSGHFIDLTALFGYGPSIPGYEAAKAANHAIIAYGKFLTGVINLVIIGAVVFTVVKQIARFRHKEEKHEPTPEDIKLLTEIRDLLARK